MQRTVMCILFSLISIGIQAAPQLSEGDMKTLLNTNMSKSKTAALLGSLLVSADGYNHAQGKISEGQYRNILGFQKLGLVTVSEDPRYRGGNSGGLSGFEQLAKRGIGRPIIVGVTDRGRAFVVPENQTLIAFPQGKFFVTKIVRNEEHRKGIDDFRLVMFTFDAEWDALFEQFISATGGTPLSRKRKGIALLKYDPFTSTWKQGPSDYANADAEFKTNNAAEALNRK